MKKKFLVFAAIVVVFVSIACLSVSAAETVASGTCGADGDNLTWVLDATGTLTISGEGKMTDWRYLSATPWYEYRLDINTVTIGDDVTSIGNYAFSNCTSLENIDIPNSVTSIGEYAFYNCKSLTYINIPKCITSIGDYAFCQCSSITAVHIPEGVISIGNGTFFGCLSLTNIEIPDNVTSIGDSAFLQCNSLMAVYIPQGVTSIGSGAFSHCLSLADINVDEKNENYISVDGVLFDKNKTTLISYPAKKESFGYDVPDSVINIGRYAFGGAELKTINIPDSVTNIGSFAFAYSSLTNIIIPDGVTTIYDGTFWLCSSLISVTLPESITTIEGRAFHWSYYLEVIKYKGDEEGWNSITKGDKWDDNAGNETEAGKYKLVFTGPDIIYADATGDGIIDNKDLVRIKKYLAAYDYDTGTSTVEIGSGADATGDGVVDNKDLVRLKKYLAAYDYDTGTSSVVLGPAA